MIALKVIGIIVLLVIAAAVVMLFSIVSDSDTYR
jgi:hypothetical protein